MLGINFAEFIIILIAVIVFVKPEEMPAFFRKAGKFYAEVQSYVRRMRSYSARSLEEWSAENAQPVSPKEPVVPPGEAELSEPPIEHEAARDGLPVARTKPTERTMGDAEKEPESPDKA